MSHAMSCDVMTMSYDMTLSPSDSTHMSHVMSYDVMMMSYDMILGYPPCHVKLWRLGTYGKAFFCLLVLKLLSLSRSSWQDYKLDNVTYDVIWLLLMSHVTFWGHANVTCDVIWLCLKSQAMFRMAYKCHIWCHMTFAKIASDVQDGIQMSYMTSYDIT